MLNVALIDSGVYGTTQYFAETPEVRYRIERIRNHWQPDFSADDLVVVLSLIHISEPTRPY